MGCVGPLITLDDKNKIVTLTEYIIKEILSVSEVEQLLKLSETELKARTK